MNKKSLLFAAATALMCGACSDDINNPGGENTPNQVVNSLTLTKLDAASQAGRVSLPGQTRGEKSSRLELVAKIAPLSDAATKHWSATGVAIANGNAYVSWHSDHQATVQATAWGGAVDVISIEALNTKATDGVITNTLTSDGVKFNDVFANGNELYFPLTCHKSGAVVGKLAIGAETMDTIRIPGSSANAIEVNTDGTLTAVTGYKGGAYSLSAGFNAEGGSREVTAIVENDAFGGKYVVNGKVLRTTNENAYLYDVASKSEISLGAPLLSQQKFAEKYDGETGTWSNVGTEAQYYGKHTMAIDNNLIYVGGGLGDEGKNGLRVYSEGSDEPVWENGTNTTAVTVATVAGKKYIFAATGAGLRVYQPLTTVDDKAELPLYAFEVLNYDNDGVAADGTPDDFTVPEGKEDQYPTNKPVAGTTGHSSNSVAVGGGYIFVATGQTGVYVFKLVDKNETGFRTTTGIDETQDVKEGEELITNVPDAPEAPAGKEFDKWVDDETGEEYTPGDEKTIPSGKVIVLKPTWKDITYTVKFDLNGGEGETPADQELTYEETPVWPTTPTKANHTFGGWSIDGTNPVAEDYKVTEDVTFKAIWNENQKYYYTISFDLENASGTVPASKIVEGYTPELTFSDFPEQGDINKPGYDFKGWAEVPVSKQSADTDIYTHGGEEFVVTKDVTFYPVWGKKASVGGTTDPEGDEF